MTERRENYVNLAGEVGRMTAAVDHLTHAVGVQSKEIKELAKASIVNKERHDSLVEGFSAYKTYQEEKENRRIKRNRWLAATSIPFVGTLFAFFKDWKF